MVFKRLKKSIKSRVREGRLVRKQRAAANKEIARKARAAGFRAKKEFAVKFAREKERIRAEKKIAVAKAGGRFVQFIDRVEKVAKPVKRRAKGKSKSLKRKASRKVPRQQVSPMFNTLDSANLIK